MKQMFSEQLITLMSEFIYGKIKGKPVTEANVRKSIRASKPEFMNKKEKKEKECMMCSRYFMSEGNHNRICDSCKLSYDWKYGNDYGFIR